MQKITPFIWFNDQADEAATFYVSLFNNSRVTKRTRYGDEGAVVSGRPAGSIMTVEFQLEGQKFVALNGGPCFVLNSAISFVVDCTTQEEVDRLWEELAAGGQIQQCGWLTDRFGVTWQIVPRVLNEMLTDQDPAKANRVMRAMLPMKKLDIAALQAAYNGT